jgi:hypothetical protein
LGTFENRKAEHCAPLQSIQNLEYMKLLYMNRASIGRNSKIRINLYTENCAVESRGHLTLPGNYQKRNEFELSDCAKGKMQLPSLPY